MAQLALGVAGAAVGAGFGQPGLGWTIGATVGGLLFGGRGEDIEASRLSDLAVQTSEEGRPIAQVNGRMRLAGQVIWATPLREQTETHTEGPGKGGGTKTTEVSYFGTWAVAFCRGPAEILKMWFNKEIIYDVRPIAEILPDLGENDSLAIRAETSRFADDITIYPGDEDQLSNPLIEANEGRGVPAHRGLCFIVFEDIPLADYGNRIPQVEAEVMAGAVTDKVEDRYGIKEFAPWPNGCTHPETYLTGPWGSIAKLEWCYGSGCSLGDYTEDRDEAYAEMYAAAQTHAENEGIAYRQPGTLIAYKFGDDGEIARPLGGNVNSFDDRDVIQLIYCAVTPTGGICLPEIDNTGGHNGCGVLTGPDDRRLRLNMAQDGVGGPGVFKIVREGGVVGPGWKAVNGCWPPEGGTAVYAPAFIMSVRRVPKCPNQNACGPGDPCVKPLKTAAIPGIEDYCITCEGEIVENEPTEPAIPGTFHQAAPSVTYDVADHNERIAISWIGHPRGDPRLLVPSSSRTPFEPPPILHEDDPRNTDAWWQQHYGIPKSETVIVNEACYRQIEYTEGDPDTVYLSAIITDICTQAGFSASDIDVSDVTTVEVHGTVRSRVDSARRSLEVLQAGFFFDIVDSGSVLKFVRRGAATVATISQDDLGSHLVGQSKPDSIVRRRTQEDELPLRANIRYIGFDSNYLPGLQRSNWFGTRSQEQLNISLPIAMTATEAKQLAEVTLAVGRVEREAVDLTLPPDYSHLEPGDAFLLPDGMRCRLIQVDWIGGLLRMRAVKEGNASSIDIYSSLAAAETGEAVERFTGVIGPTTWILMDLPLLRDEDDYAGFYYTAAGTTGNWKGTSLYVAQAGNYVYIATQANAGILGRATTVLPDGPTTVWDHSASLNVELNQGSPALTTKTRQEVYAGANAMLVGDEIIQWLEATEESDGSFTLTHLLRGRKGTEWAVADHPVLGDTGGEQIVILEEGKVRRFIDSYSSLGVERWFKSPSVGTLLEDAVAKKFTNNHAWSKHLSPVHIEAERFFQTAVIGENWRIVVYDVVDEDTHRTWIHEIELATSIGGTDLTGSGTPFTSDGGSGGGSAAFDNNTATWWASDTFWEAATVYPVHIGYDLGAKYGIKEVRITYNDSVASIYAPKDFTIERSDGDPVDADTEWFVWGGAKDLTWESGIETKSFPEAEEMLIKWLYRSRKGYELTMPSGDVPIPDRPVTYDLQILDSDGDVIREVTGLIEKQYHYTREQMKVDFQGIPSTVDVKVYTVDPIYGRGFVGEATV